MSATCPHCFGSGREPNQVRVGRKFRQVRIEAGVGQADMARAMGISAAYLCKLEAGERDWDLGLWDRFYLALKKLEKKTCAGRGFCAKGCS